MLSLKALGDRRLRLLAREARAIRRNRRGIAAIQAAMGVFIFLAVIGFVAALFFGLIDQTIAEMNSGNQTYISQQFIDRINQAENFAGLAIFVGAVVGIILVIMVLWRVVRDMF